MSERILKALMQLFAIIADPENDTVDRRSVVENFLQQQLNTELVKLYMDLFDGFLESNQEKQVKRSKKKVYSSNSVRVLKLCTEINQELTKKQKIVLIIRLLEFIRTDSGEVTENEIDFVNTVASTFNIIDHEYNNLRSFIIKHTIEDISGNEILLIDDNRYNDADNRIYTESLRGQIRILNIASVGSYIMRYLGDDELYLNGQLLNHGRSYIINVGSSLRNSKIKPIYYSDIVSVFNTNDSGVGIDFEVHHITHRFSNGKIGIHDISFSEEEGKLVGIMGVSGSGKTTLLSVLNGSEKPAEGHVLINGKDIHSKNDEINGLIGYVSQDDLLIEELTVFQNLYYNAKLCFGNYSERRIIRSVLLMLHSLGLYEIKDIMVGSPLIKRISGGQRKRLNIALELIREPAVLFLDEPTSGLSSRDSENILDLLKELTLRGKLVFVVIHQPSSDIFKMFDKLLLLDTGGHLIYNGDPVDSIVYFKSRVKQADWNESECHACGNVNPEQLFNIVESRVIDEYGNFTRTRKTSPLEWAKFFKQFVGDQHGDEKQYGSLPKISFNIPNGLKQFFVFTIRDVLSKLANKQYLALNLLLSPILAIALSFIIKYYQEGEDYEFIDNSNLPVYIFMSVIVALFIGLTVSAEEIIKDRKIRKREKFLNLSRNSYLLSKVFILIGISALQSFLFVVLGNSIIEIKGMYLEYWLMLFTVWISANLVGLNVSDTFKTTVNIYILIPFLIIPQIILSGVLVQFDKLNPIISRPGTIPWYGEFITARWAYEGLAVNQFVNNSYEKDLYVFDKIKARCEIMNNVLIGRLQLHADEVLAQINKPEKDEKFEKSLAILRNEVVKELKVNKFFSLEAVDNLYLDKVQEVDIDMVKIYLDQINNYYKQLYVRAERSSDETVSKRQKTAEEKNAFIKLKRDNYNQSLYEIVTNSKDYTRIVEHGNEIIVKTNAVYLEPKPGIFGAHFYAPVKKVGNLEIETYWYNLMVIWAMSIVLYATLYFRVLARILDFRERIDKNEPAD